MSIVTASDETSMPEQRSGGVICPVPWSWSNRQQPAPMMSSTAPITTMLRAHHVSDAFTLLIARTTGQRRCIASASLMTAARQP